ncbi:MAG: hypothetical protein L6V35_01520 [Alistipes putredinis]|nr:MAG: hypothetical protein L6V35_01520 [Alistipes putredinis]
MEGDGSTAGFLEVIEKYGSTPQGNIAKHYAGICYLKNGDLDNALAYLAKYKKHRRHSQPDYKCAEHRPARRRLRAEGRFEKKPSKCTVRP